VKINKHLNLVMQVQSADKGNIYIHSEPISKDVFEQFYLELGKVFSECFDSVNQAHLALSAPQLAYPALKSIANKSGKWEGAGGVKFGLVNEIKRLTNVIFNDENGWQTLPLDIALKQEIIDEDEESEILSNLIFFTAISKVAPKSLKDSFLEMAGAFRNWELSSSDTMTFMSGLQTSMKKESTGKKTKESLVIA